MNTGIMLKVLNAKRSVEPEVHRPVELAMAVGGRSSGTWVSSRPFPLSVRTPGTEAGCSL